jgi:hypothetical protein
VRNVEVDHKDPTRAGALTPASAGQLSYGMFSSSSLSIRVQPGPVDLSRLFRLISRIRTSSWERSTDCVPRDRLDKD